VRPHAPPAVNRETVRLLRDNRSFRLLWLAQAVSLGGDWFTLIALAVLVSRDSGGSGLAVGGIVVAQVLPMVVVGPFGGVLADRFDRRRLLVASDLLRALVVLLLVPVASSGRLPWIYALALLHFTVSTVFEPTRSALIPRLVEPPRLVAAYTLGAVTWSTMTAAGGIAGGTLLSLLGVTGAFVVDALTFFVSAGLIAAIPPLPREKGEPAAGPDPAAAPGPGVRLRDGLAWAAAHPADASGLFIKAIAGVAIVDGFLVIYGTRVFPHGPDGARSVGLLWACFGLGALLGPTLLNLANDGTVGRMRRLVVAGAAFVVTGVFLLAAAPSLAVAGLAIVVRGMGGSANWTYSTILLQKRVPDRMLGRLFALDLANTHLVSMVFTLLWGWCIDRIGVRGAAWTAAAASLVPFAAWTVAVRLMERAGGERA